MTPYVESLLNKARWRRELAMRGYEGNQMTPQLAEALRAEIRTALEADGRPFDVNIARRVYDLAVAAKDMCVAATSNVKEAISTIKDLNGPLESLDSADTPESQAQASETFGARLIRELLATFRATQQPALPLAQNNDIDPEALVHALAEARKYGMHDIAKGLEIKLLGRALSDEKSIADTIDAPEGSSKPHAFEARTTDRFTGPAHGTCEHCGKDPRNKIHTNRELFEMPEYSSNGVTL